MSDPKMNDTALVFNGHEVRTIGERLNLTDMWRAAGSDPSKAPAKWQDLPSTIEFVTHVAEILNVGKSDNEGNQGLIKIVRGGNNPRTEAHWQIGLASYWLAHGGLDFIAARKARMDGQGTLNFAAAKAKRDKAPKGE